MTGAVRPQGGVAGRIPAQGKAFRSSYNLGKTYYVDVKAFSDRFAEVLTREYTLRGVRIDTGPSLNVQVTQLSMKKDWPRYQCRMSVIVRVDEHQVPIEATIVRGGKAECRTGIFSEMVARVVASPEIYTLIQPR